MPIGAAHSIPRHRCNSTWPTRRPCGDGRASRGAGTRWNYTNGNTMLLARMIRDQAGGDAASRHARIRRRRHVNRVERYVGLGARPGTLRPVLSRRRRGRRRVHLARGLGRLLSAAHARQRNLWLRRRLLGQSRHDRRSCQAHRARHAARLLYGARHSRPIRRDHTLRAAGSGAARHGARSLRSIDGVARLVADASAAETR
jgi:hypothetical protein